MNQTLITQLREDHNSIWQPLMDEAADTIEKLIETLENAEIELREATEAEAARGVAARTAGNERAALTHFAVKAGLNDAANIVRRIRLDATKPVKE